MNRKLTQNLTVLLALISTFSMYMFASSQEPAITPGPGAVSSPPTLEPSIQATSQAMEDEWLQEYNSRSIFDFSVAYLIAPNIFPPDDLMSEETFMKTFEAEIFHTWDEFAIRNEAAAFQIVMIHDSLYEQIDRAWAEWAYRNYIMILGIGMPFAHLVGLANDQCVKEPNRFYSDQFATRVLFFSYAVSLADESYQETVNENELLGCKKNYELNTEATIYRSTINFPMTDPLVLPYFAGMLISETMEYGIEGSRERGGAE